MAVATAQDVETVIARPLSPGVELLQVNWWLDGIELFIVNRLGPVAGLSQEAVRYVEAEAAAAKLRRHGNTESSVTVSVDDGSVTRRYDTAASAADITDEWWNLLDSDSDTGTGSIRPYFEPDTARWPVSTPPYSDGWRWA